MSSTFKNESEMHKYGIAFDPRDPSRAVPIGQLGTPQHNVGDSVSETANGEGDGAASFARKTSDGDVPIGEETASVDDSPHSAERFARKTSDGAVGDLSSWNDQTVLTGLKAECAEIRALDANYPGRYHRLGSFIAEATKRLGEENVRQMLRAEGINKTMAYWAVRIAGLYTYEQAVQFASWRAIKKTLPPLQFQKPKPKKDVTGSGDHLPTAPHEPLQVSPAANDENILDRFIQLGIEVQELLGNEVFDQAIEQIKAHVPETFEDAFAEVCG